jgi:ligand-binding sensor domain-containing protein/AraC-like DNA-binding protein
MKLRTDTHRSHLKGILLALLVILSIHPFFAATPKVPEYFNRTWSYKDGLPQNTIYDINQDHHGFLWVGTANGLVRFDGANFKTYNKYITDEIKNNAITSIHFSGRGALWIGTFGGGITVFNGKTHTFRNYSAKDGLLSDFIWTIAEDKHHTIWAGTNGGGLAYFRGGRFHHYTTDSGLSDNIVYSVLPAKDDTLWIGTANGLDILKNGKIERDVTDGDLTDRTITTLLMDKDNTLWIGTLNGLNRYKDGTISKYNKEDGLADNLVRSILRDKNGLLWIATEGGLNLFRDGKLETAGDTIRLSDQSLMKLFEDREGNLWIGTSGNGLNKLHQSHFSVLDEERGLSSNSIKSIYKEKDGTIWIATNGGGLNRFDKDGIEIFREEHGLPSDFVYSVYSHGDSGVWIGTRQGLARIDNGTIKKIEVPLPDYRPYRRQPTVNCLYQDFNKHLWIGTQGQGLYVYDGRTFRNFSTVNVLRDNFITVVTQDQAGTYWIGTNGGLHSYGAGKFTSYTTGHGLSSNLIRDVHCDRSGAVWIATDGGGLNLLKRGRIRIFKTDQGLFNNVIYRILEDHKGHLWMSSNNGIFYVPKQDLLAYDPQHPKPVSCNYFQQRDGVKSAVCTGGVQPAGFKGPAGILYFPTNNGVASIYPEDLELNQVRPNVLLEKLLVDGVPVDVEDNLTFPAGTQTIQFHYTAPSLVVPEQVKFSYRLFGHDNTWHETGERESIRYDRLKHGDFRFKVIACNNDRVWNYKGDSIEFTIRPYLYQNFWFKALLLCLFFLGILSLLYKNRQYKLDPPPKGKYKDSPLTPRKSQVYLQKVMDYMEKEKPYRDPNITLAKLAARLSIPTKQMSQIINEEREQNFKNFLNQYRVEEACKKLLDPKEKDFVLLKIAHEVGFNSKSVFNAAFKKFTGMSPSEYRKKFSDFED